MTRVCSEFVARACSCGSSCDESLPLCATCAFPEEDHEEATFEVDRCVDRVIVRLRPGQPVELRNEADEVVLVALPQSDGTMKVGVASEPYSDAACGCADTPYVCGGCDEVAAPGVGERQRSPDVQETCVDCGEPLACPHGVNPEDKCDVCDFTCDGSSRCPPVE